MILSPPFLSDTLSKYFKIITWSFPSQKVEEDERKAQIKEEKQRRKEEERKRRRARGSVEEEEIEEEEDDDDEEEETNEQEEEQIDHGPSVAIRGFPSISLDKFWMLMVMFFDRCCDIRVTFYPLAICTAGFSFSCFFKLEL